MDPSNSRPMSYDSLKTLLQYAKPNLRFELSRRCPPIRKTEKVVPLRINKLLIGKYGVEVDDIKYEARIQQRYSPNDTDLKGFDFNYTSHDADWDLDEWGFNDFSSETVFIPGDLVFRAERQIPRQDERSEERRKTVENGLKLIEWMIAKKSGENVEPNWTGEAVNIDFKNSCASASLIELKCRAEQFKIVLAPFNCFEKNVPLPFTRIVQVSFGTKNNDANWRYSGNLKCYEVRKQLMTWLLGNRKHVINVNHLIVTNGTIARLPENLRISVKKLQTQSFSLYPIPVVTNIMLSKLESIIHNNNHPLEVFETETIDEDFNHPMATNARKLIFSEDLLMFPNANQLIRIPNQKMHIHTLITRPEDFNPEEIIRLIRDWIENPRETGKCFSFDGLEKLVMIIMSQIQATFAGIKTERLIKIPVNNSSQISVSYGTQFLLRERRLRLMTIEVVAA